MTARYLAISLLDRLDDLVLRHRWYWLCHRIGTSEWWGPEDEGLVHLARELARARERSRR